MSARSVRRGTWRTLFVLLLAVTLTGCLQSLESAVYQPIPPPPTPLNQLGAPVTNASKMDRTLAANHSTFMVPSPDGTRIWVDLWRPAYPDGADLEGTPVILIISPYYNTSAFKNPARDNQPPQGSMGSTMLGVFLPRGYAVALADLRGTRNSEGCIELGGPGEQADAVAVVDFLGGQSWSNGKVGMIGVSYDGWTQIMAAANNAEHLAAIVPIAPVTDIYHGVGKGGAKFAEWAPGMSVGYSVQQGLGLPYPPNPDTLPAALPADENDPRLAPGRLAAQRCAAENQAWANDASGMYNDWMKARDLRPKAAGATAPMYYVHGFADENARPDHIDPWYNDYGGPKRAFLWQAPHASPTDGNTGLSQSYWLFTVIQWFDFHLYGFQNGVEKTYGQVEVQDSLGRWRMDTAWPPLDAAPVSFAFAPDGTMSRNATSPGALVWRDDALERGGFLGDRTSRFLRGSTASLLTFRSEFLTEELHVAGRPLVRAFVDSDRPNSLVVARLYEVLPDGSWVLLNEGVRSLALRGALDSPQPVRPGEVVEVPVEMQPTELVFRAGSAIGVTITSSDADYVITTGTSATNTLHLGGDSALELPVIVRTNFTSQTWGQAQPAWLGPIAWEAVR